MLLRRYGTFTGGIDLPHDKQQMLNLAVAACAVPPVLKVPLACGPHPPATPVVAPGQQVCAGEVIAKGEGDEHDVFAPTAGTIGELATVSIPLWNHFVTSPAIELKNLQGEALPSALEGSSEWRALPPADLLERIRLGQLCIHRRGGGPLWDWVQQARAKCCTTLIANVMESQPYVCADHRVLAEQGPQVVAGLAILAKALGAKHVMLAADQRLIGAYDATIRPARDYAVTRLALEPKYPMGSDTILVKVLTRREVPIGGTTMDVGSAVIDAATCLAVWRWVTASRRALGRVVTVGGTQAPRPGNYYAPVGTPCSHLLDVPAPIAGGPMTGLRCPPDAVVTLGLDALLALDCPDPRPAGPCIRCGWCTDHCPARLNVAVLNDVYELGLTDQARKLGTPACIECGVCSYICPASLPLSQRVRQLKRVLTRRSADGDDSEPAQKKGKSTHRKRDRQEDDQ